MVVRRRPPGPVPRRGRSTNPPENEWVTWHRRYDRDRLLRDRLAIVQREIRAALDLCPPGSIRVVSLCAGDGRDLLGVLTDHPRRTDVRARLVELTPEIAAAGRAEIARQRLSAVEYLVGDAGTTRAFRGAVPAQLVLVCGVFGNVSDADVRRTVEELPRLCAAGATVVWTRGRVAPDLTPSIRRWFTEAGFEEVGFFPVAGSTGSVGVARLVRRPRAWRPDVRLFTFLPRAKRPMRPPAARRGADPERRPGAARPGRPTSRR